MASKHFMNWWQDHFGYGDKHLPNSDAHPHPHTHAEASRYRAIMEHAPGPVAFKDASGVLIDVNQRFADIHGLQREDMSGMNIADFYDVDRVKTFMQRDAEIRKTGQPIENEIRAVAHDGREMDLLTVRFLVPAENTGPELVGTMNIDVSHLKEVEAELRSYRNSLEEKVRVRTDELRLLNEQKDKFFSIIAHDLRGPFNALLGYTDMLRQSAKTLDRDQITQFAETAHEASANVFNLLENLLDWSRLQMDQLALQAEKIDLRHVIERNMELFTSTAREKGVQLDIAAGQEVTALVDPGAVDTVVRNLIANAIKFSSSGGSVKAQVSGNEGKAELVLHDTGVGMTAKQLNELFQIDRSTSTVGTAGEVGTGLGLKLCQDLMEKQGGRIAVKSAIGEGTTVTLVLPAGN